MRQNDMADDKYEWFEWYDGDRSESFSEETERVPRCSHCDAPMRRHRHGLTKGVARAFRKLANQIRDTKKGKLMIEHCVHLDDCKLSFSERTNLIKLKYWGLAYPARSESRTGKWGITQHGVDWLRGHVPAKKTTITYRGSVVGWSKKVVHISSLAAGPDFNNRDFYSPLVENEECNGETE